MATSTAAQTEANAERVAICEMIEQALRESTVTGGVYARAAMATELLGEYLPQLVGSQLIVTARLIAARSTLKAA